MSRRAPHPDDARKALRAYARKMARLEKQQEKLREQAPGIFRSAIRAGLGKQEVAALAGVHRETLRRATTTKGTSK